MAMDVNIEKLNKLAEKVRTGGPGSVRRKKQVVHNKAGGVDNRQLQAKLQSLGVRPIQGIEEVNLFKTDGTIIHFDNPHVQTAQKTFVVSGTAQNKTLQELLPGIISHLGADNIENLKKIAEQFQVRGDNKADDDVPTLVDNFETAAQN
ncbi:nascent polypeptide-associated complex NAC domain-containing protein [Heterostelium album PN500]|uniref:Nascent polypeptide-associated complex subunit beta n=1 Tax=Heterostelium pallidum (strain ATCC 26659 / Pp 5 / PN500) TaxID=670386 RepID=D3BM04_HETP5|nr:nascent polypeptide-associated complex NAC domain-containing protein [Heterostelium album PN500]EFA77605.1 nascent polypeptide-associated complex NAC domain-containing protein [Heterostelium album PN500]|eukprot:XP_020429733.1 nascent polypeptide-associated complex NAC domain-containing protein [Heterostelium album PN500]